MCNNNCRKVQQLERFCRTLHSIAEANEASWRQVASMSEHWFDMYLQTGRALWNLRAAVAARTVANRRSYVDYVDTQMRRFGTGYRGPSVTEDEWFERWERAERICREMTTTASMETANDDKGKD